MAQRTKATLKQQRFARAYVVEGNGTEAAIQAGYKVKDRTVARVIATENLLKPAVQDQIERWQDFLEAQIMPSLRVVKDLAQTSDDPRVRLAASKDLLARAGVGKQVQSSKNIINVFASMDEGLLLQKMAQLVGNNSANLSDRTLHASHKIPCTTPNVPEKKDSTATEQNV